MCVCGLFHLCTIYFDLFVYEVANSPSFFLDPETFHLLLESFIGWRLKGKREWVNVVWEVAHSGYAACGLGVGLTRS